MKRIFLLFIFQSTPFFLSAQQNSPAGARSLGMGYASVSSSDAFSSFNNQSGLAWLDGIECGAFYENRFLLQELGTQGFSVSVPVRNAGVLGLNVHRFGYDGFSRNKAGLLYARKFGNVFSMAVQINLHWFHIGDHYGDLVTASGELSFQVRPTEKWVIAAHVFNPTRTPLAAYDDEKISTIFRLGSSYRLHEKLLIAIEAEAGIGHSPTFRAGLEYLPARLLSLRAGFNSYPLCPTFGAGITIKKLKIDVAAGWQPRYGICLQVSTSYRFGK